jgi:hypothetical protein
MKQTPWKLLILLLIPLLGLLAWGGHVYYQESSIECIRCHCDIQKLKGIKGRTILRNPEMVRAQTRHQTRSVSILPFRKWAVR